VMDMSLEEVRQRKRSKMKRRFLFRTTVLAILLVAVIYALVTNLTKDKQVYGVGDEAPDFQLQQINERNELETIRLSEFQGKGVMLNFWATYCKPCEDEMPFMESLYPEYKDDIEIIAVNLDDNELVIHRFLDKYDLTFPVVHDKMSEVMEEYNIGPIPSTFFIDENGVIVEYVKGALTLETLENHFQQIVPKS